MLKKAIFLHDVACSMEIISSKNPRLYTVLEAARLPPRAITWRHSMERVLSERLRYVGSGMASSASRSYRKGNFSDQFFTKFNDTECVYNRESGQSQVTS